MATRAALDFNDLNGVFDVYARRCPLPTVYCTAKVNSLGCTPVISHAGVPTFAAKSGFELSASHVLNRRMGMLIYSTVGAAATPFAGGWICLQSPIRRTFAQDSGGSISGTDCTGTHANDFNEYVASGFDPGLVPGVSVWIQWWTRDPGFSPPNSVGLTDAVAFTIWP
jgi:hypothetical protein